LLALYTKSTGVIGEYLILSLSYLIGWQKHIAPFLLILISLALFRHAAIDWKVFLKGLFVLILTALSISHSLLPLSKMFDKENLLSYGGILGSIIAYPLVYLTGKVGAVVILSGLFLAGIVLTLRKPVKEILPKPRKRRLREERKKVIEITRELPPEEKTEPILVEETLPTRPKLERAPEVETSAELFTPLSLIKKGEKVERFLARSAQKRKRSAREMRSILEKTLADFDLKAKVVNFIEGPTVTRFEVELERGVKVQRLLRLEEDISLALASPDVRILAPIPGKSAVGIEVPNLKRSFVFLGDIVSSKDFIEAKSPLSAGIGKDITGQPIVVDLSSLPHLLIAGATGSGKSVCLNSIITSILFRAEPTRVKMILIDPKRIELNLFDEIPHLIVPVVKVPKQAAAALAWAVEEMENRFEMLSKQRARSVEVYNETSQDKIPYILIVIDELADLMMVSAKEVEDSICRLAQLGRAVGMHLVVATQRPSSDIITGLIKANITSRIAFKVSSQVDSRVIIDQPGAEKLVGKGDMLFSTPIWTKPKRLQGAYVSEAEIERVVNFWRKQLSPEYDMEVLSTKRLKPLASEFEDELLDEAAELVIRDGQASVTYLQRRLKIGYARAARLMDMLEEKGVVGPPSGTKPREVLITFEEWMKFREEENRG
jgi:S-DNA-T family DNA segregation ATPase FtsK/SpoIIIE